MATTPQAIDLCRARGDTFDMEFTAKDTAGVVIPIAGASFLMTVDPAPDPTTAANNLFQLIGVITDAPNGVFTMTMTAMQADQIPDTYFYDIQMTASDGKIRSIAKGQFVFAQDITK